MTQNWQIDDKISFKPDVMQCIWINKCCQNIYQAHKWKEAGEDEEITRDACVKLAQDHLGIPDVATTDVATFHGLSKHASSGIIMRFRDLSTRNTWLGNAKKLCHHSDAISISPTSPRSLWPMKKDLITMRKDMLQAQRSRYNLQYLRQWPYVVLSSLKISTTVPLVSKEAIVENIIGLSPMVSIPETIPE